MSRNRFQHIDIEELSSSLGIEDVKRYSCMAAKSEGARNELVEVIFGQSPRAAGNAAWALTHLKDRELGFLLPYSNRMADLLMSDTTITLRRLLLNLLSRIGISECHERGDLLDFIFTQINHPDAPPGVRALCMRIAYLFCMQYPELKNELLETISLPNTEELSRGDLHYRGKIRAMLKGH